jgi:small GTP-binding protein
MNIIEQCLQCSCLKSLLAKFRKRSNRRSPINDSLFETDESREASKNSCPNCFVKYDNETHSRIYLECKHPLCRQCLQGAIKQGTGKVTCTHCGRLVSPNMISNPMPSSSKPIVSYTKNTLPNSDYEIAFKFVLIGDTKSGKTCLTKRYCEETFIESFTPTIGMQLGSRNLEIQNCKIKLTLWDLAGQSKYRTVSRQLYRNASLMILCYDISQKASFRMMIEIYEDAIKHYGTSTPFVLIGTKSDLSSNREVTLEEANQWANSRRIHYYECSAKTNTNVDNVFKEMASLCLTLIDSSIST